MSSSANVDSSGPLARVDRRASRPSARQVATVGVRLADDDVARAGVAGDGGRHQPDRARAGDQHVLAQDREGERGVDRVAERVEDRRDLLVDARPVVPDVGHRQRRRTRRTRRRGRRPRPMVLAHRWRRPARQCRHRPQTTWPSPETRSPGWKSATLVPTSTISPTNSWPTTSGGWMVRAAHGSQDSMWRSVPQMPVLWTRIRTSLMPIGGHRDVTQVEAGAGSGLDQGEHRQWSPMSSSRSVRLVELVLVLDVDPVDDRVLHRADALDLAADAIARLRGRPADRGRRRRRPACRWR